MHLMIDLETMGLDPVIAPIFQVAIVPFRLDRDGPEADLEFFDLMVDLESNERPPFNRRASAGTIKWWAVNHPQTLHRLMSRDDAWALDYVLESVLDYVLSLNRRLESRGEEIEGVWANGPTFDLSMLDFAFQQAGGEAPWKFWQHRCVRTYRGIAHSNFDWDSGTKSPRELSGDAHDALVDCLRQIRWVQQIHQKYVLQEGK